MGYLDKATITVDAILTNRGRELLAQGTGNGNFQITKFAVADDEVDYGLYNTAHPLGSNYYGAIIENMPVLEATPDETQIMRYKLVTVSGEDLTQFGNVVIPQIQIQGTTIPNGIVSMFYNGRTRSITLAPITTYVSTTSSETETAYTLMLADSSLATVEIVKRSTSGRDVKSQRVPANNRGSIVATGTEFTINALNKTGTTSVNVFGVESGAVYNFTLSVTASA